MKTLWNPILIVLATLLVLASPLGAQAQTQANIDINTPAINSIKSSMHQRWKNLRPYFVNGAVGLTHDGFITLRDASQVPLPQRAQLNSLIAADNQDRKALYREIANANGHPDWENDIRMTFAQRWIDKEPSGWWYQNAAGAWARK